MKPVTAWYRTKKDGSGQDIPGYFFNHIVDGHSTEDRPVPINDQQKAAWKGCQWKKEHCYLDGKRLIIPDVSHIEQNRQSDAK